MFIKMRESKGFTLVELMIVVAIIGILAAVAVPYYQRYIQKARLTSLVFPGLHAIETNIGSYYSLNGVFPGNSTFISLCQDANTLYFTPTLNGTTGIKVVIKAASSTSPVYALSGATVGTMIASATTSSGKITGWVMSGSLATNLGLVGVQ